MKNTRMEFQQRATTANSSKTFNELIENTSIQTSSISKI